MNKRVLILSFSSRKAGNCAKVSKFIQQNTNACVQTYTMDSTVFPPCGSCDYECLKPGKQCPNLTDGQTRIMDEICGAHLVYFIIPNFCGGPCANYYAFNERSVGYFQLDAKKMEQYMNVQKRFIIISNTEGFESAAMQQVSETPDILYLKSKKYQKQSIAGDILDSEAAKADLVAFLNVVTL